jgi:serine/threonine protein kinase/tetratricopeptide (TPR) repeat protein
VEPHAGRTAKDIFAEAAELSPDQRGAFLDKCCAGNAPLRQHVEELLRAHDGAGQFMAGPTVDPPGATRVDGATLAEGPGSVIGPYKLLDLIGEGGFGSVFMAEQREPVARRVALKIIKLGMDTRQVMARFDAERHALEMMDHPHIARVLDAGATSTGRPYFVMELVRGEPITTFCDREGLSVPQRMELLLQVCDAVQHAHQKAVIHRDLKPGNVLVAMQDGRPFAKVIDFGIAKATAGRLTEKTLFTEHRQLIGTPEYMSPEQADGLLDIDTRSDVYSLGVLMYEVLTGITPFDPKRLRSLAYGEMQRVIREEEPPNPSTRLSTLETLANVAARRRTEPAHLTRMVRGDLDWIVMKALEKDRSRRYETANGLSMDIRRHLAGEAVLAAPPSTAYRIRKFVRKHRAALTAAAALALVLVAGASISTWQAVVAHNRLRQVEKANEIITSIFTDLDIREVKDRSEPLEAVLAGRLVKAGEQLEGEAVGDRTIAAGLQERLGRTLLSLGHPQEAIPLFIKARDTYKNMLGTDYPGALTSMGNLAIAYKEAGQLDLALPLLEDCLKLTKAKLGADDPATLVSMNNLAEAYRVAGKPDLALPLLEQALTLQKAKRGADHPETLVAMNNLAAAYQAAGKLDLALSLQEESLRLLKAKLGPDHPDTLACMNNLATAYQTLGKRDQALPLLEETWKLTKAKMGPDHPGTLSAMNNLAVSYWQTKQLDKSVPLFEELVDLDEHKLGRGHLNTLFAVANLGVNYKDVGRVNDAIPLLEEANRAAKENPTLRWVGAQLLDAYTKVGETAKLASLLQAQLTEARRELPNDSPELAGVLAHIGVTLLEQKSWAEAEEHLRECLSIRAKALADDWRTFNTKSMLGGALLGQEEYAEAEPLLLAGYEGMKQREATIPPQAAMRIPQALERLVRLYEATGDQAKAAEWKAKLDALQPASAPTPK